MVIEVNKDIDRYQESVAMGLTARQLIFSIASVVVGGSIVLLLQVYRSYGFCLCGNSMCGTIALGGFYSFNGMNSTSIWERNCILCLATGRLPMYQQRENLQ